MDNKLRIIDNLNIYEIHDNVAIAGKLMCDCGCHLFSIYHTGKVTKGILAPYLIKKDKQIVIRAICKDCGKSIIIFDSKIDGIKPIMCDTYPEEKFQIKNIDENFEIVLKYNYYQNDFKTNKFVDCFIKIENKDMKKVKQLYEGW
ncbi:MAG: hypothetical protein RBQ97_09470 [Acholeplasma sp.]|nr:hypothetical protein [Acholeplasma sp.]